MFVASTEFVDGRRRAGDGRSGSTPPGCSSPTRSRTAPTTRCGRSPTTPSKRSSARSRPALSLRRWDLWRWRTSPGRSRADGRCSTTSRSGSATASTSRSSAPTASARRPCSRCSPATSAATPERSASTGGWGHAPARRLARRPQHGARSLPLALAARGPHGRRRSPSGTRRGGRRRARARCGTRTRWRTGATWAGTTPRCCWDNSLTGPSGWPRPTSRAAGVDASRAASRSGSPSRLLLRGDDDVLLLDEPDNFLDVPGKRWLEDQLNATTKTVLYVSHDRELSPRLAQGRDARGEGAWTHGGFRQLRTSPPRPRSSASTTSTARWATSASASRSICAR